MSKPESFESTVFVVDGKTVDANGKEVEVKEAEVKEDKKPTAKPAAEK